MRTVHFLSDNNFLSNYLWKKIIFRRNILEVEKGVFFFFFFAILFCLFCFQNIFLVILFSHNVCVGCSWQLWSNLNIWFFLTSSGVFWRTLWFSVYIPRICIHFCLKSSQNSISNFCHAFTMHIKKTPTKTKTSNAREFSHLHIRHWNLHPCNLKF